MWNQLKTTLLLAAMTAILVFVGRAIGGAQGMLVAFAFAVFMNFSAYWFSDKVLLRMYGAQQVTRAQAPDLYDMVADLAHRADLPMPKLYVLPQPSPNAFATGRNPSHAAVAVTAGILDIVPADELRGVIAHELGHVKNGDILISTVAATLAGAISMLAHSAFFFGGRSDDHHGGNPVGALLALILAPLAATLIQLAVSRSREFAADEYGAHLIGTGRPLARALLKLEAVNQRIPSHIEPATAHLFIVNPLSVRGLQALFRTHPPTEERVRRLEEMRA